MSAKLPPESEIKPERCGAWKKHTDGRNLLALAQEVSVKYGKNEDVAKRMSFRYAHYRRHTNAGFPPLEPCVEVEGILGCAKGEIYRAIVEGEQECHRALEQLFGELPLRFDAENRQYYHSDVSNRSVEMESEPKAGLTLPQLDFILRQNNIPSGRLQQAIGSPKITPQRIAAMRRMARQGDTRQVPPDVRPQIMAGLEKLVGKPFVVHVPENTQTVTVPISENETVPDIHIPNDAVSSAPRIEAKEMTTDTLRIVGFEGLDFRIAVRLNLRDLRLEDDHGNILVKDKTLLIPPIPLTREQLDAIRRRIAQTVASKIV